MKTYNVSIPIAGAIHVQVDAEDEQRATEAAWAKIDNEGPAAGDVEWEYLECITEGNVCHVWYNEIDVEEVG